MDVTSYLLGKQAGGGGGEVNLQNKDVTITSNGTTSVSADAGYDGLRNVGITTDVSPTLQNKQVSITTNTTTTIQKDSGYDGLGNVEVTTNVQPTLQSKEVTITENKTTNITPDTGYDGLSGVSVITNVSGGADLSEYFRDTITANAESGILSAGNQLLKKFPDVIYIDNSVTNISKLFDSMKLTKYPKIICNSNVLNMNGLYKQISGSVMPISNVDVSGLNTSNVTDISYMFQYFDTLTQINGIENFNTNKVTTMQDMFKGCTSIQELDLSGFSNSNNALNRTNGMFNGCNNLIKIDIRNLTFSSVSSFSNMFGTTSSYGVPDNCEIIVKDATAKAWINTNFSRLTNVKTVAEYEAE
jgi:surface protein